MEKEHFFAMACFLLLQALAPQPQPEPGAHLYSTCPDYEHAVVRNVGYVEVSSSDLRKRATKRIYPSPHGAPEIIRVSLEIEGSQAFCASALNGSPEKQKAAVETALQWRFQKNRGEFKNDITGVLSFRF